MSKQNDYTRKLLQPKPARTKMPQVQQHMPPSQTLLQLAREDPAQLSPAQIVQLQQTVGNRAVSRLVSGQTSVFSAHSRVNSFSRATKDAIQRQETDEEEWYEKGNRIVGAVIPTIQSVGDAALYGDLLPGTTVGTMLARLGGDAGQFASLAGRALGKLGTASGMFGTYLGINNMLGSEASEDKAQGAADAAASAIGLGGGLYGRAFSGGYNLGQIIDQGAESLTGTKISGAATEGLYQMLGPKPGLWIADKLDEFFKE